MAVKNGDNEDVLGKLLYFSLSNVLVYKDELQEICNAIGIPYTGKTQVSNINAFRSATGDIHDRIVDGTNIYKVYFRDNVKDGNMVSRELIKEELHSNSNSYTKLANISYDRTTEDVWYDNIYHDPNVDPYTYCQQAISLFEKYKVCAGSRHIETIADNYLLQMQAISVQIYGRIYIVPRNNMDKVTLFEDFIQALNEHNQNPKPLDVNSMFIIDDEKQRAKMANEFYHSVHKEIETYQERAQYLINTNSQSAAVMNRWITKIDALDVKKQQYEDILQRDFYELNDELSTLRMFSQELQVRSRNIQKSKVA